MEGFPWSLPIVASRLDTVGYFMASFGGTTSSSSRLLAIQFLIQVLKLLRNIPQKYKTPRELLASTGIFYGELYGCNELTMIKVTWGSLSLAQLPKADLF